MAFPTNAATTELAAVNQILSSVGQAPVTTLDMQNPEVSTAVYTLREVSRQVQLEGWTFNTQRNKVYTPDAITKKIEYPTDILQLDANVEEHGDKYDLVRREGFVFDRYDDSYLFDEPIHADIILYSDFQYLPPAIQAYVTAKAARMAAVKMVGDRELHALLQEQEMMTRAAVLENECQQGDYSMFGFRDGENYYTSYQPFNALNRR